MTDYYRDAFIIPSNFAKMRKYIYIILLIASCGGGFHEEIKNASTNAAASYAIMNGISEDTICGVAVSMVQEFSDSSNTAATLLVLPGWDFERHRWLNETSLMEEAKKRRYRLILPEMKRSIYATHYYRETSAEARKEKTGKWLTDTFIPAIQKKFNVLMPSGRNFVLGLSTGGRGAVYCLWKLPYVFMAAASLSGDFDQTRMPNDYLMNSVYGNYEKNKNRWMKEDNLFNAADEIKQPLYLAHGDADKVVPFNQSTTFFTRVKMANKKVKMHLVNGAGHDFKFWGSEVAAVMDFFDAVK
jgi:esterase/lipase superfamily enzyme